MQELQADAAKDAAAVTPKCYLPIWIPVESPADRIQRANEKAERIQKAKEQAAAAKAAREAEMEAKGKEVAIMANKEVAVIGNKEVDIVRPSVLSGLSESEGTNGQAAEEESAEDGKWTVVNRERKKSQGSPKSGEEGSVKEAVKINGKSLKSDDEEKYETASDGTITADN